MSDLEELRQRVEAAEEHFGLIADQQKGYSQRLIALLNVTEQKDQSINKLEGENEQLRTMLFSLLQAIEKGDTSNTLQDMDARISSMTSQAIDSVQEIPSTGSPPPSPEEAPIPESEEQSMDVEIDNIDEVELAADEEVELDTQLDAHEIDANTDEFSLDDGEVDEPDESEIDPEVSLNETVTAPEEQEIVEMTESDDSEDPHDTEDALIAEIAENLELVLPDEESEEIADVVTDGDQEGTFSEEAEIDDDISPVLDDEEESAQDDLEDPLADVEVANTNSTDDETTPKTKEEEVDKEASIDSFLEENADEDEASAASPEIEDIMERISKQALSSND